MGLGQAVPGRRLAWARGVGVRQHPADEVGPKGVMIVDITVSDGGRSSLPAIEFTGELHTIQSLAARESRRRVSASADVGL